MKQKKRYVDAVGNAVDVGPLDFRTTAGDGDVLDLIKTLRRGLATPFAGQSSAVGEVKAGTMNSRENGTPVPVLEYSDFVSICPVLTPARFVTCRIAKRKMQ